MVPPASSSAKKYIVGINLPIKSNVHESGVALLDFSGNILFAMSEERLSRIKFDGDFPERSVKKMFEQTGIDREDVAIVAIPTLPAVAKGLRFLKFILKEKPSNLLKPGFYGNMLGFAKKEGKRDIMEKKDRSGGFTMRYFWKDFIRQNFPNATISYCDHHLAHAATAYFTSPWEDALIITIDGAGNLRSSVVAVGRKGHIQTVADTFLPHSLGSFWGSVTKACGFRSGTRHGGKTTGLAAFGDPNRLISKMRELCWVDGLSIKTKKGIFYDDSKIVPDWDSFDPTRLKAYLGEASREDMAAAAQQRLIEVVTELVSNAVKKTGLRKIVAAGGVFANVLMNQKILEMPEVDDLYIFPAMSDGGIAIGAALTSLAKNKRRSGKPFMPSRFKSPYLGPKYSDKEIESAMHIMNVKYSVMRNPAREVANLIHQGRIIALFQGRMEYGPRALGNRSMMYAPIDPTVNKWLNDKLNRSEFMPFAPVTLYEKRNGCYEGITDDPIAATYMTMTYNCTPKMKKDAPACVHIDGTARPQIIRREDNPYYYDIVNEYYKISGIPSLINTSFNMHEEPIVCSPEDALRAFFDSKVDYLVMENYLIAFEENKDK